MAFPQIGDRVRFYNVASDALLHGTLRAVYETGALIELESDTPGRQRFVAAYVASLEEPGEAALPKTPMIGNRIISPEEFYRAAGAIAAGAIAARTLRVRLPSDYKVADGN